MTDDYIEWDGTEKRIEELLMWWGTRIPWQHSENCDGPGHMHCCESVFEYDSLYALRGSTPPWDPINIYFIEPDGTESFINIGDRIYYMGEGEFKLVSND